MRRLHYAGLVLALAAIIHVDWHLARPVHHRLSLGWPNHWIFAAAAFGLVGCLIARGWPHAPGRAAVGIVGLAVLLGQGLEPVLEVLIYDGRLGYPDDPGRWSAFALCLAAGIPALLVALALCRPRARTGRSRRHADAPPAPSHSRVPWVSTWWSSSSHSRMPSSSTFRLRPRRR